jgi:hypothetical protein
MCEGGTMSEDERDDELEKELVQVEIKELFRLLVES